MKAKGSQARFQFVSVNGEARRMMLVSLFKDSRDMFLNPLHLLGTEYLVLLSLAAREARQAVHDEAGNIVETMKPAASSQQPAAKSQQPTANSQEPRAMSQQPTANS